MHKAEADVIVGTAAVFTQDVTRSLGHVTAKINTQAVLQSWRNPLS